ncbi:MAG: pilus assembly protein PilM [Planctomycetes bacterium]|nr:pilus assembly protein PilM [Planctomycetota bacterium]
MFALGGDKQIVSLDWDERSLRVVQWRISKRQARAVKSANIPVPEEVSVKDAESLGGFVRQALAAERIRTHAVIVDIPRDQAVLNTMSLPAVDLNDLAGMVQLQIAKELPFPLDDAVVDFAVTEQAGEGQSADVLVAAVRCEALDFYTSVCTHAGLKPERVGLRPYANKVAINEMLGAQAAGRVMFVDVGPALTGIGILRDGVLVFSRAASVLLDEDPAESQDGYLDTLTDPQAAPDEDTPAADGFDDIQFESLPLELEKPKPSREELIVESMMVEITRSAEAYRSTDPGARLDHIILGGGWEFESLLAKKIAERFGVPAKIYDPSPVLNESRHHGGQLAAFAAAVGLGVGHSAEDKLQFNFLAPKKPMGVAERRRRHLPLVGAIAAGLLLIAASSYFLVLQPNRTRIAELKVEIAALDEEMVSYQEVSRIVKQVEQWQEAQLIWPDELMHLSEVFPDNEVAFLDKLDLSVAKGEISFKIHAKTRRVVNDLVKDLNGVTLPGKNKTDSRNLFKVDPPKLDMTARDEQYPWSSTIVVKSARIEELQSQAKKSTRGRRKG